MKTYKTNIPHFTLAKTKCEFKKVRILSSEDAADYARQFFADDIEIFESVFIILLNTSNNTIGWAKISQGGISGSIIDTKIILKYVVDSFARSVILVHNHPSGNPEPSQADISITKRLNDAIKLMDSSLIDHIILTSETHTSLADNALF